MCRTILLTAVVMAAIVCPSRAEPPRAKAAGEVWYESVLGVYGRAIRGNRKPFINLRPPRRNLWTDEIQRTLQGTLSYEEVDYIGTACLWIPVSGTYTVEMPGAGVDFRLNGQRVEAGEIALAEGLYEVEIYSNHWGQPYLTYAEVSIVQRKTGARIPFVNSASDIKAFRTQKIDGRRVVDVGDYKPRRVEIKGD
ncbi:MAG: hypothetical protein J5I93_10990 [Pirellulaceae bacterium]|nr:hypothetical protein [Pirellulaceae bacterium]